MNIKTMRKVDYWLGIPLCLIITLVHKIRGIFHPVKPACCPEKILFIKLFGLGSIILSYPAIKLVKDSFPSSELYYLTFDQNRGVLGILDIVKEGRVITVRSGSLRHFLEDLWRVLWRIRRERFNIVVDLEFFSRFTAILSYLSGAPCRVGYYNYHVEGMYRGNFLTHKVYYNQYKHTAKSYMHLVSAMGIEALPAPRLPLLTPAEVRRKELFEKLKRENALLREDSQLVVFNVNSSDLASELRKWDGDRFVALGDMITENRANTFIVFIGSGENASYTSSVVQKMRSSERAVNVAGKTDIEELLGLLAMARVFVSCDSGPVHLAALTNVHIVPIFGPETPLLYAPLSENCSLFYRGDSLNCSPCLTVYNGKTSFCVQRGSDYKKCMKLITVDDVYGEVNEHL